MADPEVSGNNTEYQKLVRALTDIQEAVDAFGEYKDLERQLADAKELLRESEGEGASGRHHRRAPPCQGQRLCWVCGCLPEAERLTANTARGPGCIAVLVSEPCTRLSPVHAELQSALEWLARQRQGERGA